jgi:SecD-like export protein
MKTVRDILRDADPLRHEPHRLEGERDRLRQAVVTAASEVTTPPSAWFRTAVALFATLALIVVGIVVIGSQIWSQGGTTLQAAIGFEVRLAEDRPAAGLHEARIVGSDRVVYLHQEIIVTNGDIAQSSVVPGDAPSRFGVGVQFNASGAQKMRQATASHVGRPVAILIDGEVVTAPVLRSPISTSAVISGDYTKAEAERIANGIGIR